VTSRISAALLCACLAACGALSCPDRRLSGSDREANEHERAYALIAAGTGVGSPCERISPRAYQIDTDAARGLQVALTRSACYAGAAERSGDSAYCAQVVSVSSFRHDGSKRDEARCRERATGRAAPIEPPRNLDALLRELGYTSEALSDRCLEFVRVKYIAERAREQEEYVSCVKQRAVFLSENPGWSERYVCSGPNNRRAAFDACLEKRGREIEAAPERYPEGYVDGCRRLLRWGPAAQRRYEACLDSMNVARHRDPDRYPLSSEEACRRETLDHISGPEFFSDGAYPVCPMVLEAHPTTFEWGAKPQALSDRTSRVQLWAALVESGDVLESLDRLPDYGKD
jgi:hypothetical protein